MPTLLALFGPKRGVRLDLAGPLTVGRSSGADVQLVDEKVSREHCRFRLEGDAATVEDLGSHNGTWVNGARIEKPHRLAAGDEIAVGDSLFVLDGEVDAATARFGDATLVVSAAGAEAGIPRAAGGPADAGLAAVSALGRALAGAADPEGAARAVLAAIEGALAPDRAFVLLWDAASRRATPLVGKSDGAAVTVSRTVLDAAASSRRAVAVDDAVEDRVLKEAKSVVRHRLHAVLVAPIVAGEQVVGFLHADRQAKGAYGAGDAAVLEALAAVAAAYGLGRPRAAAATRQAAAGARVEHASPLPEGDRPAGASAAMRDALRIADAAAGAPSTLLVTGESGTGKEEIARHVHARGPRAGKPFVAVNCGAIPESLAESELFGHEKGAFTGATGSREGKVEAADGGTLFLDEVGDLPLSIQVKLLRVLQERAFYRVGSTIPRRVDVRVIAATHRDLEAEVKAGRFREDLFYRLNVLRIHLAPLRERPDDVEPLARALLERIGVTLGRNSPGLAKDALAVLAAAPWRGNARELANVLERTWVLRPADADGPFTRAEILAALGGGGGEAAGAADTSGIPGATLGEKIAALERTEVEAALKRARGVKTRAAEMLGISRPTLDKKIADLGIDLWSDSERESG